MSTAAEIEAILTERPGVTPGQLRDALRGIGRVSITAADVDRVLRSQPRRFVADDAVPARWWPAPAAAAAAGGGPGAVPPAVAGPRLPTLHAWQVDALDAWRRRGGRGVVEAVTGSGKTMLGVAAAVSELRRGGQVAVLVPTQELLLQWRQVLARLLPAATSVGLLGGGHHDRLADHDVAVAVVNTARDADLRPRRPGGLLVADECHRYASAENRLALEPRFARRLGLSATYERPDDGHRLWLDPYFGGTCFRLGYRRAIADGVVAHVNVALVGVSFDADERAAYDECCFVMSVAAAQLVARHGVASEPVGAFFEAVARLARTGGDEPAAMCARRYLAATQERRRLLAETPAKLAALGGLVPALAAADRSIVFTQTVAGAERAARDLRAWGMTAEAVHSALEPARRRSVLSRFRDGSVQVVTAPQVLDEGVDVPAADLAVVLAASRSRRQMVQRMGRVLRPKPGGVPARFVIVHVEDTLEDPARGAHAGFLDELTGVADTVQRFGAGSSLRVACRFLRPDGGPEPGAGADRLPSGDRGPRRGEAGLVGEDDDLQPVSEAELYEDPLDVGLDGGLLDGRVPAITRFDRPRAVS